MGAHVFAIATAALRRHRLRTALAILGVSIGIAAVIATAGLGAGSAERVGRQIDALGEDFLWIRAGSRNVAGVRTGAGGAPTLTPADARALVAEVAEIDACSPRVTGREQIILANRNWNTSYRGVTSAFFDIRNRDAVQGSLFAPFDETERARVLVLGPSVADRLFPDSNAVGQQVRLGRLPYRVIGVLESKGASRGGLDRDDAVFLPLSTVQRNLQRRPWVQDVMCSVTSPDLMSGAERAATIVLRDRHGLGPGEPDDFEVQRPLETLQLRAQTAESMRLLLVGIGSISLVVGGVGIMNIMLVSVTERRREIGIRLAIGARRRDVRRQFLLEAGTIGLCGGVAGIVLGLVISRLLEATVGTTVAVSGSVVGWVTVAAAGAGLLFGYLPAHRASELDPIEAMSAEK